MSRKVRVMDEDRNDCRTQNLVARPTSQEFLRGDLAIAASGDERDALVAGATPARLGAQLGVDGGVLGRSVASDRPHPGAPVDGLELVDGGEQKPGDRHRHDTIEHAVTGRTLCVEHGPHAGSNAHERGHIDRLAASGNGGRHRRGPGQAVGGSNVKRSRPVIAFCVVGALGIATAIAIGATGGGTPSSLVPISPCRLVDTRPTPLTVGTRSTPIGASQTVTFQVTGANGQCTVPSDATGIASNVTIVNPTASSYLTVFPADSTRPNASNLNWTPTSPPTPNQVTVALSGTGALKVFNLAGSVDVIIDVVGYYVPSAGSGTTGPTGATGSGDGNLFRTYVGTYTVRNTNSGCGTGQLRTELVAITGADPVAPLSPCFDLTCGPFSSSPPITPGDVCPAGNANLQRLPEYDPDTVSYNIYNHCVNLRTALDLPAMAVESERWDGNVGNPLTQDFTRIPAGAYNPPELVFSLSAGSQGFGGGQSPATGASGGLILCSDISGFISTGYVMPSLVGSTSPIEGNPVWSIYAIA